MSSSANRWNLEDSSETYLNYENTKEKRTSQHNDDDVICLNDYNERPNTSGKNRGGFIVNGILQYDDGAVNDDLDMRSIEENDDIDYTAPTSRDDGIQFLDIFQDHCLVPRVFSGYIKEFITERPNRLGIILSKECGM